MKMNKTAPTKPAVPTATASPTPVAPTPVAYVAFRHYVLLTSAIKQKSDLVDWASLDDCDITSDPATRDFHIRNRKSGNTGIVPLYNVSCFRLA